MISKNYCKKARFLDFSVLLTGDHGNWLVCEFDIRIFCKIYSKAKWMSKTLLKLNSFKWTFCISWTMIFFGLFAEKLFSEDTSQALLQNKYVCISWHKLFLKLALTIYPVSIFIDITYFKIIQFLKFVFLLVCFSCSCFVLFNILFFLFRNCFQLKKASFDLILRTFTTWLR